MADFCIGLTFVLGWLLDRVDLAEAFPDYLVELQCFLDLAALQLKLVARFPLLLRISCRLNDLKSTVYERRVQKKLKLVARFPLLGERVT